MSRLVDSWAEETLSALDAQHLRRRLEPLESPVGARVRVAGRELLSFSSNDYLGLATDADVVRAAQGALTRHGLGSGASRLVVGDTAAHQSLERALARFEGAEAAVLFNSGYAANVGALSALFGPQDVLFSDALNHASLIDGCRLSRAKVVVYPHRDLEALEALVRAHPGRRRAVVTDTVFSMDGDRAPLRALARLCEVHGLALVVDEAHATGVLGPTGRGLAELEGVRADVHVGTLSKALGCFGAYVAGSAALREVLLNRARSLVFSTALPAALCAAAECALEKLRAPPLRARLAERIAQTAQGLGLAPDSAVFSVVLGEARAALAVSARLREAGLLVKAIRPPTVPEGTSRLRIAVSAAHHPDDVTHLLRALGVARAAAMATLEAPHHEYR
ncbi:MAG: 8-amino-7-oxononanoate synthase [Myxococcota bacterium]